MLGRWVVVDLVHCSKLQRGIRARHAASTKLGTDALDVRGSNRIGGLDCWWRLCGQFNFADSATSRSLLKQVLPSRVDNYGALALHIGQETESKSGRGESRRHAHELGTHEGGTLGGPRTDDV